MALYNGFYNSAMVDPTKNFLYIMIPKNASTKFTTLFDQQCGWNRLCECDIGDDYTYFFNRVKAFAILRDPYERWLTGFATFLALPGQSKFDPYLHRLLQTQHIDDTLNLLFNTVPNFDFDWHTKLQSYSFNHGNPESRIDIDRITFFMLTEKIGFYVRKFLQSDRLIIPVNNSIINNKESKIDTARYYSMISNFMDSHQNIKQNLIDYLQPDYKLINSVNFYNA